MFLLFKKNPYLLEMHMYYWQMNSYGVWHLLQNNKEAEWVEI